MKKLLTIVVPTYNIAQYIQKNIMEFQKVQKKYQQDYEVLIINDGSTDDTLNIIHQLLNNEDTNIRIIDKINGGHGSTINKGIEEACGKYFKVIDGDDWIDVADFERYLEKLKTATEDLIITDYTEQHIYNGTTKLARGYLGTPDFKGHIFDLSRRVAMHAITYKTSILQKNYVRLSEGIFYVDVQYALFPLKYVKTFTYWNLNVYQYLLGRPDQSMAFESQKRNINHHLVMTSSILDFYDENINNSPLANIIKDTLHAIVISQFYISYFVENSEIILKQFADKVNNSKYKFKFDNKRKVASLIAINELKNRKFNFIFSPIIKLKIKNIK